MQRRWVVLAVGTAAQTSQAAVLFGLAVLAPDLRDRYDLSLTQVGVMLGVSGAGAVLTLLPWGLAADGVGERMTGTVGLLGAGVAMIGAAYAPDFALLVLLLAVSGAFGASINTATGRAVTSWFPRETRGFALGIRQTAVPIGGFLAALVLPVIADDWGSRAALLVLAGFSLVAACLAAGWLVEGPVRGEQDGTAELLRHPVRDARIWRLSLGSAVLVCTQAALTGFVVIFLESQRGLSATEAGLVLAAINVVGAAGRLLSGRRSDVRGGSRVALIRLIAAATAGAVAAAAVLTGATAWLLVPALVVGGGLSMCWNGLAVTATVETAGPMRSGAALGVQQTLLGVAITVTPLAFAPFVASTSWRAGFLVAALLPLVAVVVLRPLRA
ncbi:MAG TPA: MFS transporter [Gaiellaceae bacterium]